jgi:hypothetical protein
VLGTHSQEVIRSSGQEIARHPRKTAALLVLDPDHYEGATDRVLAPTPLGRRARLQLAALSLPSRRTVEQLPGAPDISRPIGAYAQLVEALA